MAEEEITVTLTVQVRTFDHPDRAKRQVSEEALRRLSLVFSDVQITEAYVGTSYVPRLAYVDEVGEVTPEMLEPAWRQGGSVQ